MTLAKVSTSFTALPKACPVICSHKSTKLPPAGAAHTAPVLPVPPVFPINNPSISRGTPAAPPSSPHPRLWTLLPHISVQEQHHFTALPASTTLKQINVCMFVFLCIDRDHHVNILVTTCIDFFPLWLPLNNADMITLPCITGTLFPSQKEMDGASPGTQTVPDTTHALRAML